ncbi:MAG: type II secretion system minor pseudopilin GspH [Nevskiales bacterium]
MTVKPQLRISQNRHQKGFTLLEILAVIVIIGIVVSFASLSLSSRAADERLTTEAQRLEVLLKLAADEAIVQGEEIGLLVAGDGYAFYHLKENRWAEYEQGSLRERALPEGMNLYLVSDGREDVQIPLPEDQKKNPDDQKKKPSPQILLLSSGELTPFVLQLRAEHLKAFYQAEGKITGQIEMKRIGDKPA